MTLPVAGGVLVGLVDRLGGDLEDILATTVVALGGFDDLLVAGGLLAGEVEGRQTVVVQRSDATVGQLATSLVARKLDAEWKGNVAYPHGCCGWWVSWPTIATLLGVATLAVGIASVIPGHIR